MEAQVERLIDKAWKKYKQLDASQRYLIALSGIPGSGKSTIADLVVEGLNKRHNDAVVQKYPNSPRRNKHIRHFSQPDIAAVLPVDGFHYTRKQLSEMPNSEEAAFRRGAAFTFDARAYFLLVAKLRKPLEANTKTLHAPSFDHAIKDPVENDIHIPPTTRIIIIEGLYTSMNRDGWREAAMLMDELWFVDVPIEVATLRVAKRNFAAGLSPSYEAALDRTKKNDMRNGREILDERLPVQETIKSIEVEEWKSDEIRLAEQDEEVVAEPRPGIKSNGTSNSIVELVEAGVGM